MQVLNSRGEVWSSAAKQTCQPFQLHSLFLFPISQAEPRRVSFGKLPLPSFQLHSLIDNWISYRHVINSELEPNLWEQQLIGLCQWEPERSSWGINKDEVSEVICRFSLLRWLQNCLRETGTFNLVCRKQKKRVQRASQECLRIWSCFAWRSLTASLWRSRQTSGKFHTACRPHRFVTCERQMWYWREKNLYRSLFTCFFSHFSALSSKNMSFSLSWLPFKASQRWWMLD